MVTFANKFNKTNFGIDTKVFKYTKLSEIYNSENDGGPDVIHSFNGVYIHNSPLGEEPVIIDTDKKLLVNLPTHTTSTMRAILADSEAVEAIKNNKVGYVIYTYKSHGRDCYGINFVDVNN